MKPPGPDMDVPLLLLKRNPKEKPPVVGGEGGGQDPFGESWEQRPYLTVLGQGSRFHDGLLSSHCLLQPQGTPFGPLPGSPKDAFKFGDFLKQHNQQHTK